MSNWKTHIIWGVISATVFTYLYRTYLTNFLKPVEWNYITYMIILVIAAVYSLIPDVDADASKINKYVNSGLVVVALVGILRNIPWLAIIAILLIFVLEWIKHRGFTHTVVFGIFLAVACYFIHPFFAMISFISFLSHIFLDKKT